MSNEPPSLAMPGVVMTDWLGQAYGVGDTVLYPAMSGRSPQIVMGAVTDIGVWYRGDDYDWVRAGNDAELSGRSQVQTRVMITPERTSRWQQHYSGPDGSGEHAAIGFVYKEPQHPVTLTITGNITKWPGDQDLPAGGKGRIL